ncbi:MAG: GH92 family glycosyl hydrolase [Agriterribacter sp.]
MKKLFFVYLLILSITTYAIPYQKKDTIWRIGIADRSANEFALAPDGFRKFIEHDFGFEDKYFLVGYSNEKKDFPYVVPGPVDTWGGTWPTSGWRINQVNILFGVENISEGGSYKLVIELADYAKKFLPLIKISINNQSVKQQLTATGYDVNKQKYPSLQEPFVDTLSITGNIKNATHTTIEIPVENGVLKKGGNCISIEVLQGSWIMFDDVRLEGGPLKIQKPATCFVRHVEAASYELLQQNKKVQPLLVNIEHLQGLPNVSVELDGQTIFKEQLEKGNYEFEAPMPAVEASKQSTYRILADGKLMEEGVVDRSEQPLQTLADYVDTRIGTAHSRWMIAPGPWMPFSMVKLSPDNQNAGWQAGYQPSYESIGTFSHIHEWTMGGLGIFATNGVLKTKIGDELLPDVSGYRSTIDKNTEEAPIGYYKVQLKDYDIKAEMTATTRCGLMRFTFPANRDSARILVDLHIPSEYDYQLKEISVTKISDYRIEGFAHQFSPNVWSTDAEQDYTVHFVLEFDQPFQSIGGWTNDSISYGNSFHASDIKNAGFFLQFNAKETPVVQMRSGISLVSIENAALNLQTEITNSYGWNFNAVKQKQLDQWNDIFNRVKITTTNRQEKIRFYNAMYRSICSRNTWSDINGEWKGTDGKIQQLKNADDVALGCDAFWNTFWNLNQMWNLVTPEWSNRWVNSQLAMYDAYGRLAKGPAGMNYIPVMVAEHEIPMMVGAYQMGIRNFNASKLLEAAVSMQTIPAKKIYTGFAGNRDLTPYLEHKYVPSDKGRFSNSMEYSYDDWTVGQLAKSLGEKETYTKFNERGYWWKNTIDKDGYCHMKLSDGKWVADFDPFRSGANEHYVEGNAWQLTFFVPQDVPSLINMIGKKKFVDRLDWGFKASVPWRYNGMNDQYWNYPVVQGNQQSMHFAFLFNWAGAPWSTQKWSRSILERYYGYGVGNAYLGDEDQGQMSAWFVMTALGLFQTDGGCNANPLYEIGSPLFEKIEIDLGNRFGRGNKFIIEAKGASRNRMYVQSAVLNGKPLHSFSFPASELLKGGSLIMQMGVVPNKTWGISMNK